MYHRSSSLTGFQCHFCVALHIDCSSKNSLSTLKGVCSFLCTIDSSLQEVSPSVPIQRPYCLGSVWFFMYFSHETIFYFHNHVFAVILIFYRPNHVSNTCTMYWYSVFLVVRFLPCIIIFFHRFPSNH